MRMDRFARRPSVWQQFFAERQIYLRSGEDSRYIALSPRLQIGVTAGALLLIGSLALTSYGYLAQRFQVVEQSRRLDAAIAGEAGQLRRELEAAVAVEAEQLRHDLELATGQIEALRAERDALETEVGELTPSAQSPGEEASRISRQLADAEAEIERLNEMLSDTGDSAEAGLADLKGGLEALRAGAAGPDPSRGAVDHQLADVKGLAAASPDATVELMQDLAGAHATIAALSADLAAARVAPDKVRQPASRAAASDRRKADLEPRLLLAEARIAELEARLAILAAGLAPPSESTDAR